MMKIFFFFLALFSIAVIEAQCTVTIAHKLEFIYPLPIGYTGQYYSEDITFVMPTDTSGATINNFEIVSIALPVGLDWICNNVANGCNYNPQNNVYGVSMFLAPHWLLEFMMWRSVFLWMLRHQVKTSIICHSFLHYTYH